jgi:hypothetical protein
VSSSPSYCQYSSYSKVSACIASHPDYCQYSSYSKEPACYGAMPEYCQYSSYAREPACIPYREEDTVSLYCRSFDNLNLCPAYPVAEVN